MTRIQGITKRYSGPVSGLLRLFDSLVIGGSLIALFAVSHAHETFFNSYLILALVGILLFQVFSEITLLYRSFRGDPLRAELATLWKTWIPTLFVVLAVGFALKRTTVYSRILVVSWAILAPVMLSLARGSIRGFLWKLRELGLNYRVAAICGASDQAFALARTLRESPSFGIKLLGLFGEKEPSNEPPEGVGVVGSTDDLVKMAESGGVDIVYLALPLADMTRVNETVRQLSNSTVNLYIVPSFEAYDLFQSPVLHIGSIPVLSVFETPLQGIDGMMKRMEDLLLGSVALLLAAIPMLAIAVAVKLTSRGPVLFRQRRYGIDGKPIDVWKFRTMNVCETSEVAMDQAQKNDPRITPLGAFLRRTSLDELPQLINVLHGRMSLVGPRPHAVAHNEQYRTLIHGYMLRHKVKPGITGLAQIRGWRGETDSLEKMEKRVECDLEYIRGWSLALDIRILLATILVGFIHKNAY